MKQFLYKNFDYRLLYIGVTLGNPFILKVGIAKDVFYRWRMIGKSMKWTIEFPIFFLPMFFARETERHIHIVLEPWNKLIRRSASGWTEWFWYIIPLSWPRWTYAIFIIVLNFTLSHLTIGLPIIGLYSIITNQDLFELLLWISTNLGYYLDDLFGDIRINGRLVIAVSLLLFWLEMVNQVIRINRKKGIYRKFSWRYFYE